MPLVIEQAAYQKQDAAGRAAGQLQIWNAGSDRPLQKSGRGFAKSIEKIVCPTLHFLRCDKWLQHGSDMRKKIAPAAQHSFSSVRRRCGTLGAAYDYGRWELLAAIRTEAHLRQETRCLHREQAILGKSSSGLSLAQGHNLERDGCMHFTGGATRATSGRTPGQGPQRGTGRAGLNQS